MEIINKQHVQVPNALGEISYITPKDLLVYAAIKKFMNKDTKEAFPSLETIRQLTGIYIGGIRKCIENLVRTGYIEVRKESGRKNIYKFLKWKEFEPFSFEFLERQDLTTNEKSYLVVSQKYMFKDSNVGKISLPNKVLSQKINMPESTISKVNKSLAEKGFLTIAETKVRDKETGVLLTEKIFHLTEFGQAIVFILKNHEDRIKNTEEKVIKNSEKIIETNDKLTELEKKVYDRDKTIELLLRKITALEKQNKPKDIIL